MLLVDAEYDRFRETVGFFHERSEVRGEGFRSRAHGNNAFKVARPIFGIRYFPPVAIQLALGRTPTGGVEIRNNPVHSIWREEAIGDALRQTIFINGIAEVAVGVGVVLAFWCSSHADLVSLIKPLKDFSPIAIIAGAAAMALIDNNQVKEIFGIVLVDAFPDLTASDRLIDREIDVTALADFTATNFKAGVAKNAEILVLRIIDQNIAVGEEKDFWLSVLILCVPAAVPKLPTDLERDGGFPGASTQRHQHAFAPL